MDDAGAGLLTLHAAAAGLALAGADAAADAHAVLGRAFVVANFVEFHDALLTPAPSRTTRTRCLTFSIMPRTAGVSSRVETAVELVEPEADQRLALLGLAADRRADLLDGDGLGRGLLCHRGLPHASAPAASASPAIAAAGLQRRHLEAAARRDRARAVLVLQRVEGGADEVVGVRRAERLRDHVLHAERLEHGAHRAAGDDAGALRRRAQHDLAGAVTAVDVVMQRAALAQRDADHRALGGIGRLADRLRHLAGLAVAEADAALLVADDDEGREAEATAALHHLGDAVDVDQPVDEFAVALVAIRAISRFSRHEGLSLARAAAPARSKGGIEPAVRSSARPRGRHRPAP